jgi:hypothetical protein
MKKLKTCSVEGCGGVHYARGWCMAHYWRWYRGGDVKVHVPVGQYGSGGWADDPTPHDQLTFTIKPEEVRKFREFADWLVSLNNHAAARYRMQNARDDAAEHAMAAD